jgi:hypothetical protein
LEERKSAFYFCKYCSPCDGASGNMDGWLRHYATRPKVVGSIPVEIVGFFSWPNASSHTMALGSIQALTEMSTVNLHGCKGRPAHMADSLIAICEPIVWKMWEPYIPMTTLWPSTDCYRDSLTIALW